MSARDDMALPPGKTCADCRSFKRCQAFIGVQHINDKQTRCDWSPSAFIERPPIEPSNVLRPGEKA